MNREQKDCDTGSRKLAEMEKKELDNLWQVFETESERKARKCYAFAKIFFIIALVSFALNMISADPVISLYMTLCMTIALFAGLAFLMIGALRR